MVATQKKLRGSKQHKTAEPSNRRLHVEPLEDRRLLSASRAVEAINHFGLDVYDQMQREEGNLFYSPLSVATGLAMAYAGAAGQTAAELEQVVHLGSEPDIHASFAALMDSFESHNEPFSVPNWPHVLMVANAIWPDDTLAVEQGFLDIVAGDYGGHVQTVDYGDPQLAKDTINQWVANHTLGKIPELVSDLSAAVRMVLTNAVYFNGYWEQPFDPRHTTLQDFTTSDGETVVVPTLYGEFLTPYTTIDDYQVLEMPFDGGLANADYSMVLVLPPESGPQDLDGELVSQIDVWLDESPEEHYVVVTLPKLDVEVSTGFNEVLIGLGMPSAFESSAANFSGMTPDPVWIGKVFHKATLTVNEQGTTAAAATEIDFFICFAAGTPVLTPDGPVAIEHLKPGDLVLARDENNLEGGLEPKTIEKVHRNEAKIVEVQIDGEVVRTTAAHPMFLQGKGWTAAGELSPGDKVSTSSYEWAEVEAVEFTSQVEQVYNFRVADFHTYFVQCKGWDFGVWVHNACGNEPEFFADRPYHLLIRDNITGTIAFMGRIDNPLASQNEINPTVTTVSGDFDDSQAVDGRDFLAWQRGHGASENALRAQGDSDSDGDVDGEDLANWERSFGDRQAALAALGASDAPLTATARDFDDPSLATGLVNAAMAIRWLETDARDQALARFAPATAPTAENPVPRPTASTADQRPNSFPRQAVAPEPLVSRGDDGDSQSEIDDDPFNLAFDGPDATTETARARRTIGSGETSTAQE